ncbi:hypothetical protein ACFO5K_15910 [Nocardia halotolerans]|uniref:DUF4190 domain-containing protein n=1 Tax=Nocardia halotolerans TaxID=1755878 RepID=A0ABV8VIK4_9NOCA
MSTGSDDSGRSEESPQRPEVSHPVADGRAERPAVAYGGLPSEAAESVAPARQSWSTVGFVFAAIALLLFPLIFGVIGIGAGLYGHKKGEALGYWAAVAALTALLAGLAIRVFFFDADLIPAQN